MKGARSSKSEPVPLRHRSTYALYRLLRSVLSALPLAVAVGLGGFLGWTTGAVFRLRRGVVEENLARAFPNESKAWRRRVAVDSYRHLGREAVMTIRLGDATPEDVRAMIEIEGLDAFRDDFERGKGVVLVTGHVGNWEIGSASLAAHGFPIEAVAHQQRNRRFDEELRETRGRLGMKIIPRNEAPRRGLRALREHKVLGLVADQNVASAGVFVDFFGVPAASARGPAVFALRTGAPLWLGAAIRSDVDSPRYLGFVRPLDVTIDEDGDPEENILRMTRAIAAGLEETIRSAPEQYFWHHRRWKTRPPEESPSTGPAPPSPQAG
jgi:KDO2-lipid IV(A) lauroyltransferase